MLGGHLPHPEVPRGHLDVLGQSHVSLGVEKGGPRGQSKSLQDTRAAGSRSAGSSWTMRTAGPWPCPVALVLAGEPAPLLPCPPTSQVKASWVRTGTELTGGRWMAWEAERLPGP